MNKYVVINNQIKLCSLKSWYSCYTILASKQVHEDNGPFICNEYFNYGNYELIWQKDLLKMKATSRRPAESECETIPKAFRVFIYYKFPRFHSYFNSAYLTNLLPERGCVYLFPDI